MKIYYSNKPMQHVQYLLDKSGTEMNRTEHGKVGNGKGKRLVNEKGQWDVGDEAWGVLELVWPKPGMLPLFPS